MSYYKILELSPGASQDEIKQAYRKLAMKWHPDRNQNSKASEEKFKAIKHAYEALSHPDYRYIPEPPKPAPQPPKPTQDYRIVKAEPDANVPIELGDVEKGKRVHACKRTICFACSGSGRKEYFPPGSIGETVWRAKQGYQYETKEEKESDRCPKCKGIGEIVVFDCWFDIPVGVPHGVVMKLQKIDFSGRQLGGTANIKIYVKPDSQFERIGNDLYHTIIVRNRELLEGGSRKIRSINGRNLQVSLPLALEEGTTLRLVGCGLPDMQTGKYGNMYLKLKT